MSPCVTCDLFRADKNNERCVQCDARVEYVVKTGGITQGMIEEHVQAIIARQPKPTPRRKRVMPEAVVIPEGHKQCRACGEVLPIGYYCRKRNALGGRMHICHECLRERIVNAQAWIESQDKKKQRAADRNANCQARERTKGSRSAMAHT
jgi:hypothetical protein